MWSIKPVQPSVGQSWRDDPIQLRHRTRYQGLKGANAAIQTRLRRTEALPRGRKWCAVPDLGGDAPRDVPSDFGRHFGMAPSRLLGRKLRTFLTAGAHRQRLVAEAVPRLLAARLILRAMPFERMSRSFGTFVAPDDPQVKALTAPDPESARLIEDIGWAVRATAPFMPFQSLCLQQAMAARAMLRRRGIACRMHFGAGRDGTGGMIAHAWVEVAGLQVTGYPVPASITEIGCFV